MLHSPRQCSALKRVRRHLRITLGHLGLRAYAVQRYSVRGWRLHPVGAYIRAAYWFSASTSFANPAVTFARAAGDTFAGIRLADVPGFIIAQCLGAAAATILFRWLIPSLPTVADDVIVPHSVTKEEVEIER
jgi:Major intrinsic protein